MNFKGTKGPWRIDANESSNGILHRNIVQCNDGKAICSMTRFNPSEIKEELIQANASLIASAPDLLKACEAVVKGGLGCAPSVGYMDELKEKCQSAIDKAIYNG